MHHQPANTTLLAFVAGCAVATLTCYGIGAWNLHRLELRERIAEQQRREWETLDPAYREGIEEALNGPQS